MGPRQAQPLGQPSPGLVVQVLHQPCPAPAYLRLAVELLGQAVQPAQGLVQGLLVGGELRHQHPQGAAAGQGLEVDLRPGLAERLLGLDPHPLGHQVADLAAFHQAAHQLTGLLGDGEAEPGIAGQEARGAQHPQRVLDEGRRDMAQHAGLQVDQAAVGVDQRAIGALGHGVDGQVPAGEILLQGHLGTGVDHEAGVTVAGLALGARQGVLLVGHGVQEDREVTPHRPEAAAAHLLRGGAHHHPVVVVDRPAQARVAHGAPHAVDLEPLHGGVPRRPHLRPPRGRDGEAATR